MVTETAAVSQLHQVDIYKPVLVLSKIKLATKAVKLRAPRQERQLQGMQVGWEAQSSSPFAEAYL